MPDNDPRPALKPSASWAPMPLRLMCGVGFMIHGYPKLFDPDQRAAFVSALGDLGVPLPELNAWAVGGVEFVGGLALILGVAVTLFSLLLIADMAVATSKVHLPSGFSGTNVIGMADGKPVFGLPGFEVNALYAAMLLALILMGPGKLRFGARKRPRTPEEGA